MKKWIFFVSIICVISCEKRYSNWPEIIRVHQNGGALGDVLNVVKDEVSPHVVLSVLGNVDSLKIENFEDPSVIALLSIKKSITASQYEYAQSISEAFPKTDHLSSSDAFYLQFELGLCRGRLMMDRGQDRHFIEHVDSLYGVAHNAAEMKPYLVAKISLLETDYYFSMHHYIEALAALHYGLHALEQGEEEYPLIRENLLGKKASILLDRSSNDLESVEQILDYLLINSVHDESRPKIISDLVTTCWNGNKMAKADSLIARGIEELSKMSAEQKNYFALSVFKYYMVRGEADKAVDFFEKYPIDQYQVCDKNIYVAELYELQAWLQKGQVEAVKHALEKVVVPQKCNSRTRKIIEFYKGYIEVALADKEEDWTAEREALMHQRSLAKQIYDADFDLHLDDFYAKNLESILNNFSIHFNDEVPKRYWKTILELYSNTRNRQMNLALKKEMLSATTHHRAMDSLNFIIQNGLSASNDFARLDDYYKEYYPQVYRAVRQFGALMREQYRSRQLDDSITVDMPGLEAKLNESRQTLVCVLLGAEKYWAISFDGQRMRLHRWSIGVIDSIYDQVWQQIKSRAYQPSSSYNDVLQTIPAQTGDLVVVPDGKLAFLPLDLFGHSYYTTHSINAFVEPSPPLKLGNVILASFSDTTTRRSITKQEVGELYHDDEECQEIKNVLGDGAFLFHGMGCTFENLFNSKSIDLLHVASHGGSNMQNRLGSYIYLREEGRPAKAFVNDLYRLDDVPKFVTLSLCDSGVGRQMLGSGTYSLSRPFLENGSRAVLKTLWKTDDKGNRFFMARFYSRWMEGHSASKALHLAKKDMRMLETYSEPFYWAGFVLEGDGEIVLDLSEKR